MANTKLGVLYASLALDEKFKTHFGAKDIVAGQVLLNYRPAGGLFNRNAVAAELFGPLKVTVILSGKIRIKVRRDRSHHMPTDHSQYLFEKSFTVFDGTLKTSIGDEARYPFEARFLDDTSSPYPAPGIGMYAALMQAGKYSAQLPPTLAHHFSDYPDVVDLTIMYRLGLHVDMPGIDVKTIVPERDARPFIKYDLPRPPKSLIIGSIKAFKMQLRVQNEYLLPENERPSGFKAKAKAVFSSSQFPEFVTDLTITGYEYIFPGQKLKFEIVLRRNDTASTTPFFPETVLEVFKLELKAFTAVDTSERLIGSDQCNDSRIVQAVPSQTKLPLTFSKANDHTITLVMSPLQKHPASFRHRKLSMQYLLGVHMQFKVANKTLKQSRDCPVVVVPPPLDPADEEWIPEPPPEAGPSQPFVDDELPSYGEAGSSKLLESAS